MREILFRGKICRDCKGVTTQKKYKQGDWAFGDLSHTNYNPPLIDQSNDDPVPVDPATVGQYTGLTDKNGKRIFEGDIIKVTWGFAGRKPVVSYLFVEFAKGIFETKHIKKNKSYGMLSTYVSKEVGDCGVFCEVIGNLHDNPEMMEVQSDG